MLERILVVGLGSIGSRHARLVRELLPSARIAALRHSASTGELADGLDYSFSRLEDALAFHPQVAVIANPASFHLGAAQSLAQVGAHLLVEKPLSNSTEGIAELINTCRNRNLTLMVAYNLRFLPSLRQFRLLLQQNRVGRVLSVRAEIGQYLPTWRPQSDYRYSVSAKSALGGGVLLELSHEIDYLQWLFGDIEWVQGMQCTQSDLEIDVEDSAHLILGFVPRLNEVPIVASLNMDFIRHDTTRVCTVIGETGTLRWNALTGAVDVFDRGKHNWENLFEHRHQRDDSYLAEWRHFLDCIETGLSPMITGQDGLATLRVIEAARESSRTGSRTTVKWEGSTSQQNVASI